MFQENASHLCVPLVGGRELGGIFTLRKQTENISILRQKQTLQYANNIVAIIKSYQTN